MAYVNWKTLTQLFQKEYTVRVKSKRNKTGFCQMRLHNATERVHSEKAVQWELIQSVAM